MVQYFNEQGEEIINPTTECNSIRNPPTKKFACSKCFKPYTMLPALQQHSTRCVGLSLSNIEVVDENSPQQLRHLICRMAPFSQKEQKLDLSVIPFWQKSIYKCLKFKVLLYSENNKPVGYLALRTRTFINSQKGEGAREGIEDFFVIKSWRRQGVGKALFESALSLVASNEYGIYFKKPVSQDMKNFLQNRNLDLDRLCCI